MYGQNLVPYRKLQALKYIARWRGIHLVSQGGGGGGSLALICKDETSDLVNRKFAY